MNWSQKDGVELALRVEAAAAPDAPMLCPAIPGTPAMNCSAALGPMEAISSDPFIPMSARICWPKLLLPSPLRASACRVCSVELDSADLAASALLATIGI